MSYLSAIMWGSVLALRPQGEEKGKGTVESEITGDTAQNEQSRLALLYHLCHLLIHGCYG